MKRFIVGKNSRQSGQCETIRLKAPAWPISINIEECRALDKEEHKKEMSPPTLTLKPLLIKVSIMPSSWPKSPCKTTYIHMQ